MQSTHAHMMAASWNPKCDTCGTDSELIHYFKEFSSKEGSLECGWCRPDYMLKTQVRRIPFYYITNPACGIGFEACS
jgi:hypothetical protein